MARTPSTMVPLGSPCPPFSLPDVDGRLVGRDDAPGPLLVMFLCNHCPFVVHVLDGLLARTREWRALGLRIVAINANDVEAYPEDAPARMAELAAARDFPFPYLFDATQEVARAFDAACTPDFFLYGEGGLFYRGQMDTSRPGNGVPVTGDDLDRAVRLLLAGGPPPDLQLPSLGCNIKWRSGR